MEQGAVHSDGGLPARVTGTPLFVAYSLLAGNSNVHTTSTHMESLYYSIWHSAAGSLPDERAFRLYGNMKDWATARLGTMVGPDPLQGVREDVKPFLWELHQLFWPQHGPRPQLNRTDVTVQEFVAVCLHQARRAAAAPQSLHKKQQGWAKMGAYKQRGKRKSRAAV